MSNDLTEQILNDYSQLESELTNDAILTNLSLNSRSKTEIAIFGQVHWYNQLRIAEQIIIQKQKILSDILAKYQQESPLKNSDKEQESAIPENQDDSIFGYQLRDTYSELQIALAAKKKILSEHPEIVKMSYDYIQESIATEANLAELSHKYVCQMMAKQGHPLPYESLEFLMRMPKKYHQLFLKQLNQKMNEYGVAFQLPENKSANNLNIGQLDEQNNHLEQP